MTQRLWIGGALSAGVLLLASGSVQAVPVGDGAGNPGDTYYIPPGYFAPGVPGVGTLEQQQMMADAVDEMWALGDELKQDLIEFGDQAILDLDLFISMDPEPWDLYDAAVELEDEIEDRAALHQQLIAASVVPIFGDVESSLPAPPTELLTAAFGPTLTSIGLLWVEADFYQLEIQSRRPMERPDEPAPPAPTFAAPEAAVQAPAEAPSQPQAQQQPTTPSTVASNQPATQTPMTEQQLQQVAKVDREIEKSHRKFEQLETKLASKVSKQQQKLSQAERRAESQLNGVRAQLARAEGVNEKQATKLRKKVARLEQRNEQKLAKQRAKLQRAQTLREQQLDMQRLRMERLEQQREQMSPGSSAEGAGA